MTDIVERLKNRIHDSHMDNERLMDEAANEIELLRQQVKEMQHAQAGFMHISDMRQAMIDTADENATLRQQLAECQAQSTKLSERVVGVGEIAINSVSRDRLAECQAKVQKYRGDIARDTVL